MQSKEQARNGAMTVKDTASPYGRDSIEHARANSNAYLRIITDPEDKDVGFEYKDMRRNWLRGGG